MSKRFSKHKIFDRYFCCNCGKWFRTGCYFEEEREDPELKSLYDDVCPKCGANADEWWRCISFFYHWLKSRLKIKINPDKGKGRKTK